MNLSELRDFIKEVIKEAAEEGKMQKIYRRSFKDMIKKTKSGNFDVWVMKFKMDNYLI